MRAMGYGPRCKPGGGVMGGIKDSDTYAFPFVSPDANVICPGMTLRDWFAGQALAGMLAGGFADTIPHDDVGGGEDAAFFAYQYADAMLAARATTPTGADRGAV
jgi:hypothetical protein